MNAPDARAPARAGTPEAPGPSGPHGPAEQAEEAERAAWADFVRQLGTQLAGLWPAMAERLGDRYDSFVELGVQQALERGFTEVAAVARYVDLWFVWGPAFHDKPGYEWAAGVLAAPIGEWVKVHQLVRRSLLELERLPGALVEPRALAAVDARLVETFGSLGRHGSLRRPEPAVLPLVACDLEAADVRLLDDGTPLEYRLAEGEWRRQPVASPAALRVDAARPLPARLTVITAAAGRGRPARLQVRVRPHATCDVDAHPALAFSGPQGRWQWLGHASRAASWPVAARDVPPTPAGPGSLIAEETSAELYRLAIEVCGLRDEGDPLGPLSTLVAAYPAAQWWMELQRAAPAAQSVLPGPKPWSRGITRCRVECDGTHQDATPLRQQFEEGLDAAVAVAAQKLAAAWEQSAGVAQPALEAELAVLSGRAAFSWGWRQGGSLEAPASMRLVAALEMQACRAALSFSGELSVGGARARVTLGLSGQAPLAAELLHEGPAPVAEALLPVAQVRWRFPFTLTIEPLAAEGQALLQATGPAAGALVGEAGLRPNLHGGSGFEWFAALRLEAVTAPLEVYDPLLGVRQALHPLLPAMPLAEWSLG